MCKKATSCLLALLMVCTLALPALADEKDYATTVNYTGNTEEKYTLTVPATLAPGNSGDVELSGTWSSNHTVRVTADAKVTMSADIGGSKELAITFPGISLDGSNTATVSETQQVSVEGMTALFGTWTGVFNYNVDAAELGTGGAETPDPEPDEDEDIDWSDAVEFTLSNSDDSRAVLGYTAETSKLVIPANFIGTGNNGTVKGQKYKVTALPDLIFLNCSNLTSVTISEGITEIGTDTFCSCENLASITLPASLNSIGEAAFDHCEALTSVVIPEGVTSIGDSAFSDCIKLASISLPAGLESIGVSAFARCEALNNVVIPEGVTSIGTDAFESCDQLTSITLPTSLTSISRDIFAYKNNVTDITFTGTKEEWKALIQDQERDWDTASNSFTIHCTDGDFTPDDSYDDIEDDFED